MKDINDYTIGELKELIEKKQKKNWREECYGKYYIQPITNITEVDNSYLKLGAESSYPYAFKEKKEAELFAQKTNLMLEMTHFAAVCNKGWVADFSDGKIKYGIRHSNKRFRVDNFCAFNVFVFGLAVKSKEIAEEMFEEFGERIKNFY